MGLKCSVFGHDYADYDVERERADHGREVVTIVRTTEICRRCGDSRIVSENTEIAAAAAVDADEQSSNGEESASPDEGDGHTETAHERAADAIDGQREDGRSPSSSPDGFEFDTRAGPVDRVGQASESRSVGPTTAAATSRSLADSELRCPACEFSERVLGSALRAGDSCPECSRGYLARRTRKE